ncbi:Zinc finger BED domain-containing protein DAYSLEEPER, partial [Bienertia sinuspersici]
MKKLRNEFSSSSTPTSNVYFKGVWGIQCIVVETANGPHLFLVDMYSSDYSKLLYCACVLDPRFKLKFVEYCYTVLYGEIIAKEKVEKVGENFCNFLKEYRDLDGDSVGQSGEVGEETTIDVPIAS